MNKFKIRQIWPYLFVIMTLIIGILYYTMPKKEELYDVPHEVSFIVSDHNPDNWENMRQGALQAGDDLNTNVRFIYMSKEYPLKEQLKYVLDAKLTLNEAMILVPYSNNEKLVEACSESKIPIVYAMSNVVKDELNYIGSTSEAMGEALANDVIRRGNFRKKILILTKEEMNPVMMDVMETMFDDLNLTNNQVEKMAFNYSVNKETIQQYVQQKDADIIISTHKDILKYLVDINMEYENNKKMQLYGFGVNKDIISWLENEEIVATLVQDEYSIGYLSVQQAISKLTNKKKNQNINVHFAVIDSEHMYEKANERLLFPFRR